MNLAFLPPFFGTNRPGRLASKKRASQIHRYESLEIRRLLAGDIGGGFNAVQALNVAKGAVIAEFVAHKQDDQRAGGEAYGQAHNINNGKQLVPRETAQGGEQVVGKHGRCPDCY